MRPRHTTLVLTMSAIASILWTRSHVYGQAERADDPNARQLTIFDRQGRIVSTVPERGAYSQPAFSPDGLRLAVVKTESNTQNQDVWVIGLPSGESTRLTSDPAPDNSPAWSPDGRQIAFISLRAGSWGLYRKASTGEGPEELLYRHSGFGALNNPEWSADGRFIVFSDLINISGALYVLPLDGSAKAIEVMRPALFGARISPNNRFVAYQSNQSGRSETYVRGFDVSSSPEGTPIARQWQVSNEGTIGTPSWRRDGQELFYLAADRGVMAVDVITSPPFQSGTPRLLFRAPQTIRSPGTPGPSGLAAVSPDGLRFVFAVPPSAPLQQLTVLDRRGNSWKAPVEPGPYGQPSLSPDGTRVAVVHTDLETGSMDIWAIELFTGKTTPVTSDPATDTAPVWSPDGNQIAFVSTRGDYTGIYRMQWNGEGAEELLYTHTPGTPSVVLTDWSPDGRFLSFHAGNVVYVVALNGDRRAIEIVRTEFSSVGGRFSPDSHFLAYLSDESGKYEVYVRPFDPYLSTGVSLEWRISDRGAQGMIFWRDDGKELGYLASDGTVMSADVATTPVFRSETPKPLFRPPSLDNGGPYASTGNLAQLRNASRDRQRFVFAAATGVMPAR